MNRSWVGRLWTGTAEAFDNWASTYEEQAASMLGRRGYGYEQLAQEIASALCLDHAHQVLEIGTGPGNLGAAIAKTGARCAITGLDISLKMATLAESKRVYESVSCASFERLPFANGQFHHVYSAFVLHSVLDQDRALDEIWRVLRPGGLAVLVDLCPVGRSPMLAGMLGYFHSLRREHGAPAYYRPIETYVRLALDRGFEIKTVKPLGHPRKYMHFLLTVHKNAERGHHDRARTAAGVVHLAHR